MSGRLRLYEQVKELFEYSEGGVHRVGTGIEPLDKRIRGVAPGEVCMVLGRSYAGKSVMAQNIIANNPTLPSIFFSMEMPYVQALVRLHAITTGEQAAWVMDQVEKGTPPPDMWLLPEKYPLHDLREEPNQTFSDMSRLIDEYSYEFEQRPEFVVIDYLELLEGTKRSGEGLAAIDKVTTHLKDWAKLEQMRVFVLHQCNRNEPKWEPPTESSPRFGGYTESDFVIGMWKPVFNPKLSYAEKVGMRDDIYFNIIKNRPFGDDAEEIKMYLEDCLRITPYA